MNRMNTYSFIQAARKVHGRWYSYSNTYYDSPNCQVCITCRIHGDFYTLPNMHLSGGCCPKCHNEYIFCKVFDYYYPKRNC